MSKAFVKEDADDDEGRPCADERRQQGPAGPRNTETRGRDDRDEDQHEPCGCRNTPETRQRRREGGQHQEDHGDCAIGRHRPSAAAMLVGMAGFDPATSSSRQG
jgi:hypothetical protein